MRKYSLGLILSFLLAFSLSSPAHAAFGTCAFGDCGTGGGGGGASISDAAYGPAWDGDTTTGASKNSLYDKIETIVAGGLDFALDSTTTGNIRYVGCSDDIQTAVTAATAGDTLVLGSCTYTISTAISGAKALNFVGQGVGKTIINSGTTSMNQFTWTADGLRISDMSFRGTRLGNVISVDLTSGTGSSGRNNVFNNLDCNVSDTVDRVSACFDLADTGAVITNTYIHEEGVDWGTSSQNYGIKCDTYSTMDVDMYLYVRNVTIENISLDTSGNSATEVRGIRFYNNLNGDNPNNMYLFVDNVKIKVRDDSVNAIEALHMQGARIYAEISNSTLDGYGANSDGLAAQNKRSDFRCDDGAECRFRNTVLVSGFFQNNNGTVYREGFYLGSGIRLDKSPQERASGNGVDAKPVMQVAGADGADGTTTTTSTAGQGAGVSIIAGDGGVARSATVTGTAGDGGGFTFRGGRGGNQSSPAATNQAGAGGTLIIQGGLGGSAKNGTDNTGGQGGDVYIVGGRGNAGSKADGRPGHVFLGTSPDGSIVGNVMVGRTSNNGAKLGVSGTVTTDSTITSTRTTDLGWSVVNGTNTACNTTCTAACVVGIDILGTGGFLGCTDATADSCICAGGS